MSSSSDLPHGLQAARPQVLAHFHGKAGRRVGAGWRLAGQTVQAHPRLQQHENLVAIISGAGQLEQQGLGEVGGGVWCVKGGEVSYPDSLGTYQLKLRVFSTVSLAI